MGKFATNDCADLGDFLGRTEPVKAGSQRVEQRRRNSEGGHGTNGYVSVADVLDQLGFQYALGEFLDEQRNPVRLVDDLLLGFSRQRIVPDHLGDNSVALFAAHPIET